MSAERDVAGELDEMADSGIVDRDRLLVAAREIRTLRAASAELRRMRGENVGLRLALGAAGSLLHDLSFGGGRVFVRHERGKTSREANAEWWERLRPVALVARAALGKEAT